MFRCSNCRTNFNQNIINIYTVERTTKTTAICENDKRFRIDIHNGVCSSIPKPTYRIYNYQLETDELKSQYKKQVLISKLRNVNLESLTEEQLQNIFNIAVTNKDIKT